MRGEENEMPQPLGIVFQEMGLSGLQADDDGGKIDRPDRDEDRRAETAPRTAAQTVDPGAG